MTQHTATLLKQLENTRADQRLYRLSAPVTWYDYNDDGDRVPVEATCVVVSAAWTPDHGNETYIFPSTEDGEIISWGELEGSFIGGLDHVRALRQAGYEVTP